jgi:hypothetical protein
VGMRQPPSLAPSSSHPRVNPDAQNCCLLFTLSPECGIDQTDPAHHNGLTDSSDRTSAPTRTVENQGEIVKIVIAIALALSSALAVAHGGGLDKNGCHTNHKTGDRHCH